MTRLLPSFCLGILFLCSTVLPSCSSSTDSGPLTPDQLIIGSWNWVKSTGGIGGVTLTPDIVGYTQKRVYDSKGMAYFYRDTALVSARGYIVNKDTSGSSGEPEWEVRYSIGDYDMEEYLEFPHPDTLFLAEKVMDGFMHVFTRMR